ncbi:hypothetical protein BNJ_00346 [Kaumoebavirus]|uniref:hypothetical protein n=1 Tax=Kaumoebavirus TaxID=1859492 RepID=UPI0009C20D45|nr:hypothetical protein BNJ_00346 [Kaumoebavirus]ARA72166.1 hypothetical protein BNJ_00346 [Kaumoebavirus]
MNKVLLYKEKTFEARLVDENSFDSDARPEGPLVFKSSQERKEPLRLVEYSLHFRPIDVKACHEARSRGLTWLWNEDEFALIKAKKGFGLLQKRYTMKTPGDLCIFQARRATLADVDMIHQLMEEELCAGKLENGFTQDDIRAYLSDPSVHAYVLESQKKEKKGIYNLALFRLDELHGLNVCRVIHLVCTSAPIVSMMAWTLLKAQSLGLSGLVIPNFAYVHSKLELFRTQEVGKEGYYYSGPKQLTDEIILEETPTHESTLIF